MQGNYLSIIGQINILLWFFFFSEIPFYTIFPVFLCIKISNNSKKKKNHIFILQDWLETNFTNQPEHDNGGIIFNVITKLNI